MSSLEVCIVGHGGILLPSDRGREIAVIKRTIEISRDAAHLCVKNKQLLIRRQGKTVGSIPCEDIGIVLVDHPGTTYTHAALVELSRCDAAVVICGKDHLPAGMLLPMADHSQVVWRIHDQIAVGRPLQKQLWKQLVQAKIRGQAENLAKGSAARSKLLDLARSVRSGDPQNIEAQAARVYWAHWLGDQTFRRNRDATDLNAFLNYGYAVVRAAIARALVSAGLLPALGIHHCNRSNSFCLADDLIEPLRPLVDDHVRSLHEQGYQELNQPAKAAILELLTLQVTLGNSSGPLMVSLHRLAASLVRCYQGEAKSLEIPQPC